MCINKNPQHTKTDSKCLFYVILLLKISYYIQFIAYYFLICTNISFSFIAVLHNYWTWLHLFIFYFFSLLQVIFKKDYDLFSADKNLSFDNSIENISRFFFWIFLVAEKHFLVETESGENNSTDSVEETSPEPRESNARDYSMYGSCLDQAKAMRRQGTKSQYSIIA